MTKFNKRVFISGFFLILMAFGCSPRAKNSGEAIKISKSKATAEAQAKYLIRQAKGFIKNDQFEDAIKAATYVISNLDPNSTVAQDVIEKAQREMHKIPNMKIQEVKSSLGGFGG